MQLRRKLHLFYITSVFGVIFAVLGFSYNAWRMELSEDNNNIRTACFEVLLQLSELEQIIYAAHYDQNAVEGSPRKAWVKIGLIRDLSRLIGDDVATEADALYQLWKERWDDIASEEKAVNRLVHRIDSVRMKIKLTLKNLE